MPDYATMYTEYWQRPDRWGSSSFADPDLLADQILSTCAGGKILDVGCGMGVLVRALLMRGVDARGVDVAGLVVEEGNRLAPGGGGRFECASVLSLPHEDESFDTVVCTDCLEHLAEEDVAAAVAELARVARRGAMVTVSTAPDRDQAWHLTVRGREWWETRLFEAGFRKHPLAQRLFPYESLEHDEQQIMIPLEKIPAGARREFPLGALREGRDLHMDMLRESGRRADAHVARYMLAAQLVRPGDTVLDGACGLGYGSHILAQASQAVRILGIDADEAAVGYARACYGAADGSVEFRRADAADLSFLPDGSVDLVVSMETLEHLADPDAFLAEIHRVLTPAGRVIVSVPNQWTDELGRDPNPHHLQVYDYDRLLAQVTRRFRVEAAYAQTAGGGMKHPEQARMLRRIDDVSRGEGAAEWWVMVGMKSPMEGGGLAGLEAGAALAEDGGTGALWGRKIRNGVAGHPYRETVFPQAAEHPECDVAAFGRDYDNPWLVRSMVSIGLRANSGELVRSFAEEAYEGSRRGSADAGAALCVLAYQALGEGAASGSENRATKLLGEIAAYDEAADGTAHAWRWRISNRYAAGLLLLAQGRREEAEGAFVRCAELDPMKFSPLLATKTVDALFQAGRLAACDGRLEAARGYWRRGLEEMRRVLSSGEDRDWANIWCSVERPLSFGLFEVGQLVDLAGRCAAGLRELERWGTRPGQAWQQTHQTTVAEQLRWAARLERARTWLTDQRSAWKGLAESREGEVGRLQGRVEEIQRGLGWHREQHENWKKAAEEKERVIGELRRHVEELVGGRKWLEEQAKSWQGVAEERAAAIEKLKGWIAGLESGKKWLEDQRASWEGEAGKRDKAIEELREWIARLEEQGAYWRQEAMKGGGVREGEEKTLIGDD